MQIKSLVTVLMLAGAATAASANTDVLPSADTTFTPYGTIEGWNIFVNEDRKTCMIESVDANENVVQMGLTADRGVGYLGVFTKADIGVTPGEDPVAILIGENLYLGSARTLATSLRDGYTGGYVVTDDPQFVTDIMQQYTAVVLPDSDFSFVISLDGTMKAIEAARECTAAQGS